jgi:anti-sigma factor RsiW
MVVHPSGWTCERTRLQLESYLLGRLVLVEALAVAEHLEACDTCAQRLALYRLTIGEVGRRG